MFGLRFAILIFWYILVYIQKSIFAIVIAIVIEKRNDNDYDYDGDGE